jgi:RNA polymerase sigma-70 factor, ECF subfamily
MAGSLGLLGSSEHVSGPGKAATEANRTPNRVFRLEPNPLLHGSVAKMNGTIEQLCVRARGPNPVVSWSDEKLLLSYRSQRESRVFEELVHRYEKELYGYLRHYLGSAEMAEDVFQQTFLQVHLKCDQFEPGRKVRPWLYTIAVNQAIDSQRRNRRHRMTSLNHVGRGSAEGEAGALVELLGGSERDPADDAESTERCDALRRAVDALPKTSRQVIMLVYFQGLKYREAAEIMDVPVGTVKSRLHAAMQKLTGELSHVSLPK